MGPKEANRLIRARRLTSLATQWRESSLPTESVQGASSRPSRQSRRLSNDDAMIAFHNRRGYPYGFSDICPIFVASASCAAMQELR